MILLIDTTNPDQLFLGLCKDKNICTNKIIAKRNGQLEILLPQIEDLLKSQHAKKTDLTAIAVNEGPGTYTGLRIGITTANTLAWSLDIPVLPFQKTGTEEIITSVHKYLSANDKFSKPVSPKYPSTL